MLLFQNTVLKLNTLEMRSDTSNASSPFARGAAFTTSTITSNMPPTGPQVVFPYDQSGMAMEGIIYSPSFIATGQLEALPGSSTNWFAGNYAFPSNLAGGPSQQSASAWDSSTSSISLVLLGSMAFTCTMALVLGRPQFNPCHRTRSSSWVTNDLSLQLLIIAELIRESSLCRTVALATTSSSASIWLCSQMSHRRHPCRATTPRLTAATLPGPSLRVLVTGLPRTR